MKKVFLFILLLSLLPVLPGCGKAEPGVTYPEPESVPCTLRAETLTDQDARELGRDPALSSCAAFSFQLESPAESCKFLLYRLENGVWEDIAGGSWIPMTEDSGTLLLQFEDLGQEARITLRSGSGLLPVSLSPGMTVPGNRASGFLTSVTEAQWGQQIPLAVQAVSPQDRVPVPDPEIWEEPEAWANLGYEEVFLLTVSFRPPEAS